MLTPGFSRAIRCRDSNMLSLYPSQPGGISLCIDRGIQMSGDSPTVVPKNSGGATPTIEKTVAPIVSFLFSTAASRERVLLQERSPDNCLHSQHGKIAARNELNVHRFIFVPVFDEAMHAVDHAESRRRIGEHRIPPLHLAVEGVGVEPGIGKSITDALIEPVSK